MAENKEEFGVKMDEQLKEWQRGIKESKNEAEAKGESFFERFRPELEKMQQHYDEARVKLHLMRKSGEEAWEEMRKGFDNAMRDLTQSYERARKHFEE